MNTAQHNQAWASLLARHLQRPVVMSPGSRNTPLVLAYASMAQCTVHTILDERAAGFFALGLARVTQSAVVLVCTSGSAGAHYLPAIIEANHSGIPLIVLTADRPPELQHCGAPQTIDQTRMFGTHTRFFADIGAPAGDVDKRFLRSIAAQALDHAEGTHPGPVHLNVPFREPLWTPEDAPEIASDVAPRIASDVASTIASDVASKSAAPAAGATNDVAPLRIVRGPPRLDAEALQTLSQRLASARRGVIVASGMADGAGLREKLGVLAARLGWPILAEATSHVRSDATQALRTHVVSAYDALLRDDAFAAAHAPDVVLRFGDASTSKVIGKWLAEHAQPCVLAVHPQGKLFDPHHTLDALLVANPVQLVDDLLVQLPQGAPTGWLAAWRRAERCARRALDTLCTSTFCEPAVMHAVHRHLPKGGALHVGSSMPVRDVDSFAPPKDIAVFSNRGANGIDGTLSCALGTAVAWPGPTALLVGDLTFLHDVGALQLARQLDTSLTVVVINNDGGGIFDFLGIAQHPTAFEPCFRTPQRANVVQLAHAAGAHAEAVHDLRALGEALESSYKRRGSTVIEAVMPPDADNVQEHRAAWAAVAASLLAG